MKLTASSAALAAIFVFAQSVQAQLEAHVPLRHVPMVQDGSAGPAQQYSFSGEPARSGEFGGRPGAWCGWEMRQLVGDDPGPAFNLARNWAQWGRPGPAGIGAVVVWPHHVGKIVGQENGMWLIQSGNDGNAVRTRPQSLAGVIAIRWG
jgi:hypothetical protein